MEYSSMIASLRFLEHSVRIVSKPMKASKGDLVFFGDEWLQSKAIFEIIEYFRMTGWTVQIQGVPINTDAGTEEWQAWRVAFLKDNEAQTGDHHGVTLTEAIVGAARRALELQ